MAASFKNKRLQKELQKVSAPPGLTLLRARANRAPPCQLHEAVPPGIALVSTADLSSWKADIAVLDTAHPIYAGHTFRLVLRFGERYPIEAPEVYFDSQPDPPRPIPLHPHIYSNGMVCLDLLGSGWSPVQNVESICVSLQSMLSGNLKAERPEGDHEFCRRYTPGKSKGISWVYDDDKV